MANEADAIAAVRQYLGDAFPGWTIEDRSAMPERQAHRFVVVKGTASHQAILSFEFLTHTPLKTIPERLRRWQLADEMRDAGAQGVLVTERVQRLESP